MAFIALHGRYGEDGCVQGLLESIGIPYTGSGVLASALGMDKVLAKQLFGGRAGARRLPGLPPTAPPRSGAADLPAGLPGGGQAACEGSSVGVHVVKEAGELAAALADAARYKGDVLVEQY